MERNAGKVLHALMRMLLELVSSAVLMAGGLDV